MSNTMHWIAATIVLTSTLAASAAVPRAQEADPLVGTWKLDLADSNFDPGPTQPGMTATLVIKKQGNLVGIVMDLGQIHYEYASPQDGSDVPITITVGGRPSSIVDTVAERRINPRTVSRDDKKNGKITRHQLMTMSHDGRTLRVEIATINAQGVPVNDFMMFDKQ
jgi:hypothetical protein